MNIDQQKAKTILNALICQNMVQEAIRESKGEKITHDNPLIREFAKFSGLSDESLDAVYEAVFENLEEYENYTFWDNFAEKIAIVKREEEKEQKGREIPKDKAFIAFCKYMDKINDILDDADQIDLWKYIAKYFKTNSMMQTND